MQKPIYEYQDYKAYLIDIIRLQPNEGRGERSKIAALLRCHVAYISQVLNGTAHLSLEQADVLNAHFSHSPQEADFFILLVQVARAGTLSLRNYYKRKIEEVRTQRKQLKNRLKYDKELSPEVQPTYYSAWYYTAIHFSLAVPELQTKEALSQHLSLPAVLVGQVLEFLVSAGLAIQTGTRFQMSVARLHLSADSPLISKHHSNWRLQALQSLERNDPKELHYSSVAVLSEEEVPKVREALVRAIEEVRSISKPESKYETLHCYSIDLFRVGEKKELFINKFSDEKRKKNDKASVTNHLH